MVISKGIIITTGDGRWRFWSWPVIGCWYLHGLCDLWCTWCWWIRKMELGYEWW